MEGFVRKKLHVSDEPHLRYVANAANVFADANAAVTERAIGGGYVQVGKPVDASRVPPYHGFVTCHSTEEESSNFKLKQGLKIAAGTPIKKLLAEEMSNKMETRRRPPSVIARLMGLDTLPPQQPSHKQQKKFSDNYLHRTTSVSPIEKQPSYGGRSLRMSNKEQQEFKDVFEVETSKTEMRVCSSVQNGPVNSKLSETRMEYVRQKFMDVKRLSTDANFQHSKEFNDALEVLDSNKDLLLKFLQEPDSLFTKHVHDLQGFPPSPQTGRITVLRSLNAHNYVEKDVCSKPERKKESKNAAGSVNQYESDLLSHSHKKHGAHVTSKVTKSQPYGRGDTHLQIPKSQPYERDDNRLLPTRIVVLKPNLRKALNPARPVKSPCSSGGFHSSYRKQEHQSSENLELFAEVRERRSSPIVAELIKHRDRGSREIAKEITRQMRRTANSSSMKFSGSRLRGYAGDESSCTMSGDDSENEFDMMTPSRHFSDRKSRYSPSSSHSTETSVSREAKKRLSERWKVTHGLQDSRTVGRGSTLAEMLAMPDREIKSMTSDPLVGQDNFSDQLVRKDGAARWAAPLGISSKDGWKDECARSLRRSRSLPASSTGFGFPTSSIIHESLSNDKRSMLKEAAIHGSNKLKKGGANQREGLLLKSNVKASHKKSYSVSYPGEECHHTVQEKHLNSDEPFPSLEEKNLSEQKPMILAVFGGVEEKMQVTDETEVSWDKDLEMSVEMCEEQPLETAACATSVKDGDFFAYDMSASNPQRKSSATLGESSFSSNGNATEAESPASSKEVEQPSPLSVLEPLFAEDFSSGSDSFERVSADLHELRMQLQLLKLESSEACSEELEMVVSSDDDTGEGSLCVTKEEEVLGLLQNDEKRDFSYLVDMLIESGLHDADHDAIMTMWYSPELPVGLSVCEELEKKHGEQMTWQKSERRLLFDRINLSFMDIFQHQMDPHPWVKKEKIALGWNQEPLAEKVWNSLVRDDKAGRKDLFEVASGKETKWLALGDDVDAVGREIERLLFDELVDEVLSL